MAEQCVAAVFVGPERPLELQEFPVPSVGPDNILVKNEHGGGLRNGRAQLA